MREVLADHVYFGTTGTLTSGTLPKGLTNGGPLTLSLASETQSVVKQWKSNPKISKMVKLKKSVFVHRIVK
jgi:hypothetical protein